MLACFGNNDCKDETREERKFNAGLRKTLKQGSKEIKRTSKAITKQTKKLNHDQKKIDDILTTYNNAYNDNDEDLSEELRYIQKTMKGGGYAPIAFLAIIVVGMSILGSIMS